MTATAKLLFDLTAADLMSGVAVVLREWQPLRQAAEELFQFGVSGAPVVDATGRCVGVLSVSDLARWAVRRDGPAPTGPRPDRETDRADRGVEAAPGPPPGGRAAQAGLDPTGVCLEWQMVGPAAPPAEDVRNSMTAAPVTVGPDTPIREIARRMLDAGVRRVIVTDPAGRPVGVVSTTDLVAAVAAHPED